MAENCVLYPVRNRHEDLKEDAIGQDIVLSYGMDSTSFHTSREKREWNFCASPRTMPPSAGRTIRFARPSVWILHSGPVANADVDSVNSSSSRVSLLRKIQHR